MPIAKCSGCQKQYKVKDDLAGKRIKCPNCGSAVPVPVGETVAVGQAAAAAQSAPVPAPRPTPTPPLTPPDRWYMTNSAGEQFGPVPKSELDAWVAAGSVNADCQVLRDGDPQWQWADAVYPQLAPTPAPVVSNSAQPFGNGAVHIPNPLASVMPPSPIAPATTPGGGSGPRPRLLTPAGSTPTMWARGVMSEAKSSKRGVRVVGSQLYQVGNRRSWWERAKSNSMVGWYSEKATHVDQIDVVELATNEGKTHVIIPLDAGVAGPCEFLAVLSGYLPTSVALLRGEGGNWGFEASGKVAPFVPPPIAKLIEIAGSKQPSSHWSAINDAESHAIVQTLESNPRLKQGVRFDCKINMGAMSVMHSLQWFAQAMPLGEQSLLLVVQMVPKKKMLIGFEMFVDAYFQWRDEFLRTLASARLPGDGEQQYVDEGQWFYVAHELLGLDI
jgi:hypothetical protein